MLCFFTSNGLFQRIPVILKIRAIVLDSHTKKCHKRKRNTFLHLIVVEDVMQFVLIPLTVTLKVHVFSSPVSSRAV